MPKKINKQTAEEKQRPSKEAIEKAKKELEMTRKDLELLEKEFELRTKFKEVMLKAPQAVDAKWAYERLPEFTNLKREDIELGYEIWLHRTYKPNKEFLQQKIKDYEEFLRKWGDNNEWGENGRTKNSRTTKGRS